MFPFHMTLDGKRRRSKLPLFLEEVGKSNQKSHTTKNLEPVYIKFHQDSMKNCTRIPTYIWIDESKFYQLFMPHQDFARSVNKTP